jgi:hypothetical protein
MRNLIILSILFGGLAYGSAKFYLHKKVESGMDNAVVMMSPYADITYKGVSSTMSGKLTVNGINARIKGFNDDLRIDKLGIDTPNFLTLLDLGDLASSMQSSDGKLPEYIGFIIEGMHMPANADYYRTLYDFGIAALGPTDIDETAVQCTGKYGFSPATLAELGYQEQLVSMAMYMRQSGANYSIDISASTSDMWDVSAQMSFAGHMKSEISKGPMYRPKLSRMQLELTDRSLNQRVKDHCNARGLTDEEILQAQLEALEFFGETNGIVFDEYVITPYKEYLGGKSTLIVTAQPTEPLNLSQIALYKPSDVPALLNLEATAH